MGSESFKDRFLTHLHAYRRDELGIDRPGKFNYRGALVEREHILDGDKWLNIPSGMREQVRTHVEAKGIKLHQYFHHLNSSQAFALALFVPFFGGGADAASALLSALGQPGQLVGWETEAIPCPEEGTNLDARWLRNNGVETFCEVKLTEDEFGKAENDVRHQTKLREIYAPRLSPYIDARLLEADSFFSAYQILRNLWHAAGTASGRVLFLYPRQHTLLTRQLFEVMEHVKPALRDRIDVAHTEDVLTHLTDNPQCPQQLRNYAVELTRKYVLAT
jgi:hypothetical protein